MNYIFGLIAVIVSYLIWNIIKYIINKLFPNFYEKHEENYKVKEDLQTIMKQII